MQCMGSFGCDTWAWLPHGLWDLSSLAREPLSPCIGWWILNHWTTGKSPVLLVFSRSRPDLESPQQRGPLPLALQPLWGLFPCPHFPALLAAWNPPEKGTALSRRQGGGSWTGKRQSPGYPLVTRWVTWWGPAGDVAMCAPPCHRLPGPITSPCAEASYNLPRFPLSERVLFSLLLSHNRGERGQSIP